MGAGLSSSGMWRGLCFSCVAATGSNQELGENLRKPETGSLVVEEKT